MNIHNANKFHGEFIMDDVIYVNTIINIYTVKRRKIVKTFTFKS